MTGPVSDERRIAPARRSQLISDFSLWLSPLLSVQETSTGSPAAPPLNLKER